MAARNSLRESDWGMITATLLICAIGTLQIYSATHDTVWDGAWWRQAFYVAIGIVLFWVVTKADYHTVLSHSPLLYGASLAVMVITNLVGQSVAGGQRWLLLPGGFHFQVSEFAKLVIISLVARYLTESRQETLSLGRLAKVAGLIVVPFALVAKQPDLGTALTYLPVLGMGVFLAGLPWKYWVAIGALGLGFTWVAYNYVLQDYQKGRLTSFLNPEADPKGSGYQVVQSKIAIGSGGIRGRGVTKGSQTQLRFLPVPHTDFIFATFGEENGFAGVVFVLSLYFWLLMQIVQNAQAAPDRAGMFICMGVAALLLFHLLVNVGMVAGLMPVTGIPLPLMSYGGSNMLSVFLMLGLVNNVRLRRFVN
jgi:rod shape determining protein RodA